MNIELIINFLGASATYLSTLCASIPTVIALIITAQQLRESVKQVTGEEHKERIYLCYRYYLLFLTPSNSKLPTP